MATDWSEIEVHSGEEASDGVTIFSTKNAQDLAKLLELIAEELAALPE